MKTPTYTACCGRKITPGEYNPGSYTWRNCVWCALKKAFAAHGLVNIKFLKGGK